MRNNYFIFLDDWRHKFLIPLPEPDSNRWVHCKHYYDFIFTVSHLGLPEFISWDYDLDRQSIQIYNEIYPYKTGLDCALWLIEYCKAIKQPVPPGQIHSTNIEGGPKIAQVINDYNKAFNESLK